MQAPDASMDRFAARSVLWVGAHPDDEASAAPLLAHLCIEQRATCTFLVFTRGEGGNCGLAACPPDLGTFRAGEMQRAAALYNAALEQWDLGNEAARTLEEAAANFARHAGGSEALVARVVTLLERVRPELVLTFDPRSGVTCHPDHLAAGAVLLTAARRTSWLDPRRVFLLAGRFATDPMGVDVSVANSLGFAPVAEDPAVLLFDASSTWNTMLANLRVHASQFSEEVVAKFAAASRSARTTPVLSLAEARENDARYSVCR